MAAPFGAPTAQYPGPGQAITAVRGDPAGNWAGQSRSEVVARRGMVATSQALDGQAGHRIVCTVHGKRMTIRVR